MGIMKAFLPHTTEPIAHLAGADVAHPELAGMRERRATTASGRSTH
jgi:hypothetical protein